MLTNIFCEPFSNNEEIKKYIKNDIAITDTLVGSFKKTLSYIPKIKKVIFNKPATIVFWFDDTKTVVKCEEYEEFDPEKGLAMAITKKALGNNGNYYNVIKKWLTESDQVVKDV